MNCASCFFNVMPKKEKESRKIMQSIIFSTPRKLHYSLFPAEYQGQFYLKFNFLHNSYSSINYPWIKEYAYQISKTFTNKKITVLQVKNLNAKNKTVIISHSFDKDIGALYPMMIDIATTLKCNVITYEYSQFSYKEGETIEDSVQMDLENVIDFTVRSLSIPLNNIILLSWSSGSIPTISVASGEFYQSISCIILINPVSYGYSLVAKEQKTIFVTDMESEYNNIFQAQKITCNVLLIHGKKNTKISINQSQKLCQNIKKSYHYFPTNGTHNNIFTHYRGKIFKKIQNFLEMNENINQIKKCPTYSILYGDLDSTKMSELDNTRNSTLINNNTIKRTSEYKKQISPIPEDEVVQSYMGKSKPNEIEYNEIEGDFIM